MATVIKPKIEVLLRDGIPLNEHFFALKSKYTSEKENFDKMIHDLKVDIMNIEAENKQISEEISQSNQFYHEFTDKLNKNTLYYKEKIYE